MASHRFIHFPFYLYGPASSEVSMMWARGVKCIRKSIVASWASFILWLEDFFSSCPGNSATGWHLALPVDPFLPASVVVFVVRQPITQDRSVKRWKEGREQLLRVPASEFSNLHLTTLWKRHCLGGNSCCLSEHVFLHDYSSSRWLTTLTTHSGLFQHIMRWLMSVDEQRMLCGATVSIMHRQAKPSLVWAALCTPAAYLIMQVKHFAGCSTHTQSCTVYDFT